MLSGLLYPSVSEQTGSHDWCSPGPHPSHMFQDINLVDLLANPLVQYIAFGEWPCEGPPCVMLGELNHPSARSRNGSRVFL